MRNMRKYAAVCLSAVMAGTMVSLPAVPWQEPCLTASAAESGALSETLSWSLSDTGTLTISGTGAMPAWGWDSFATNFTTDPITVDVTWKDEAPPWYESRYAIKEIILEEGVTTVSALAFIGCTGLTSVSFPRSLETVEKYAFSTCISLTAAHFPMDGNLTELGNDAFSDCTALQEATYPDTLTALDGSTFEDSGITSVHIPAGVTTLGSALFLGCTSLQRFTVAEDNPSFASVDGALYTKDMRKLLRYPTASGTYAVLPDTVQTIGARAFADNQNLEIVVLPESLTSIISYAFEDCQKLTAVYIPPSVLGIGTDIFKTSTKSPLLYICYGGTQEQWAEIGISDENEVMDTVLMDYTPETPAADMIGGWSRFNGNTFWKLDDNGSLYVLSNSALPAWNADSVTQTGDEVTVDWSTEAPPWYEERSEVKNIVVAEGIQALPAYAFAGCSSAESVSLPASLQSIGTGAFKGSNAIQRFTVAEGNPAYKAEDGILFTRYKTELVRYPQTGRTFAEVPATVEIVHPDAFAGNTTLKMVSLPDTSISVENGAFSGCSVLDTVFISEKCAAFGDNVFADSGLQVICFGGTQAYWNSFTADIEDPVLQQAEIRFGSTAAGCVSSDLSNDGLINSVDASLALQYTAAAGSGYDGSIAVFMTETEGSFTTVGSAAADSDAAVSADMNQDAIINTVDAATILQYTAAAGSGYSEGFAAFLTEQ